MKKDKNYTLIVSAYSNSNGCYIGDEELAEMLYQAGINPEPSCEGNRHCSIGFCAKEQKWYGWSHRAMYGFGIGSHVKKGSVAFNPSNEEEFIETNVDFWRDKETQNWIRHSIETDKIDTHSKILVIEYEYNNVVKNKSLHGTIGKHTKPIPTLFGRGEWIADTLDEAKQMAIDFSDNIG